MIKTVQIAVALLIFVLSIQISAAANKSLQQQRKQFVLAEKWLSIGDDKKFFKQTKSLKNYPLYPYIQYKWLAKNLGKTKKVKAFLKDYKQTKFAGSLSYKWKYYLARNKKWKALANNYKETKDTKLQCHYMWAKYKTGLKKDALLGAKKLWVVGKSQPDACNAIFKVLKKSSYYSNDLVWERFRASLAKGNVKFAKFLKRSLNKKDQHKANRWLRVHLNPGNVANPRILKKQHVQSELIFTHGIKRFARKNLSKAIKTWDARKKEFKLDPKVIYKIERKLAMALALNRDKAAYDRFNQIQSLDDEAKEWRVRSALRLMDWEGAEQSIFKLSQESQNKGRWQYWLARAMEKNGREKHAGLIFSELSKERSYYGYLSANKLNKSYQLVNHPVQVTPQALKTFKKKTDFRVVAEFIELNKLNEAKKQWWYSVRKLSKEDILIAAKYAQQLNWKQESIFTIAKAKYWDDVPLRFPMAYQNQVHKNAKLQNLSPAVIFGLIRRESAFNEKAYSPVGARGLMQIMPNTGRHIARKLKEKWRSKKSLFNPEINLRYGAFYYKELLNQFNGHYALAAAAYNAGPHRVKRWLPEDSKLPADIWVETIPFKETRGYVAAVLTYALIYQKQLNNNSLSMSDFMQEVLPG